MNFIVAHVRVRLWPTPYAIDVAILKRWSDETLIAYMERGRERP